jgi:hypothetical protein
MAPYTMTIELKNKSDRYISFIGHSTLSSLDGRTEVQTEGDITSVKISKSGGTDGLFTALSFCAVNGTDADKNVPFTVWATMPASAGSSVEVKLVDATNIVNGDYNRLRSSEWADTVSKNGSWYGDQVERSKFTVCCWCLVVSVSTIADCFFFCRLGLRGLVESILTLLTS